MASVNFTEINHAGYPNSSYCELYFVDFAMIAVITTFILFELFSSFGCAGVVINKTYVINNNFYVGKNFETETLTEEQAAQNVVFNHKFVVNNNFYIEKDDTTSINEVSSRKTSLLKLRMTLFEMIEFDLRKQSSKNANATQISDFQLEKES